MTTKLLPGPIEGLVIVEPVAHADSRGFFLETYKSSQYGMAGVSTHFLQGNHSCSSRGVLRGLHYQLPPHAQGKLVSVIHGSVWDVAVDMRRTSATFGNWYGIELSGTNHRQLWIPAGFAHGFIALENDTHLVYQCTKEYQKSSEAGVRWDDAELAIQWPLVASVVSAKDQSLPGFKDAIPFP